MNSLNQTQRKLLISGVVILILMGLFPPWIKTYSLKSAHNERPAEYAFIASPPKSKADGMELIAFGAKLDILRLMVQWVVVVATTGLSVFVVSGRK